MFWPEWGVLASLRLCIASKRLLPEVSTNSAFDFSAGQLELRDSSLYACVNVREKERVNKAKTDKETQKGTLSHTFIHWRAKWGRQRERERETETRKGMCVRQKERKRVKRRERFPKLTFCEKCFDIRSVTVYLFYIACVCVCVKERVCEYVAGVVRL